MITVFYMLKPDDNDWDDTAGNEQGNGGVDSGDTSNSGTGVGSTTVGGGNG